jgi:hypothetical protein
LATVDSMREALVLDAYAHPNVRWPGKTFLKLDDSLRSFRQYLECVTIALFHHTKDTSDELERNRLVKQVTHAVHEDKSRGTPVSRDIEGVIVKRQTETGARRSACSVTLVLRIAHRLQSSSKRERIAVITSG